MKVAIKVVMFLVPVFVVLGLIRFWLNGFDGDFVPNMDTLTAWFQSFPDIGKDWNTAVSGFSASSSEVCPVTDPGNVFDVMGAFWCSSFGSFQVWFSAFGQVLSVILLTPFRVLGWLFGIFVI